MADEKLKVQVEADASNLQAGTEAAATAVESSANRITSGFEHMKSQCATAVTGLKSQIESGFSQINKVMGAISGAMDGVKLALEGGKAFKEMVEASKAWTGEAIKLSKQLNVTTESASALMVASRSLGLTNEQVEETVKGFVQQVRENEAGLNKMGIATKDGNGHTRDMMDIMVDANTVLLGYKEGKDRDAAATAVYGQEIKQNSQFLQMNKAAMEEAKRRQEELGIEVGPKAVAQYKEYNRAINDVNLILDAMKIQIGNAVMPVLTVFGSWLSGNGPQLMEIFKGALNGIVTACEYVGLGFIVLYETVKTVFERIAIKITTAGQIIDRVLHGDFSGAVSAYKNGVQQMSDATDRWLDKLAPAVDKTNSSVAKMWGLSPTEKSSLPSGGGGGGKEYHGGKEGKGGKGGGSAEKSSMAVWENEREKQKIDEKAFFKDSLAEDLAFWEKKITQTQKGSTERFQVEKKVYELKKQLEAEDLQTKLKILEKQSEETDKVSQKRIEIAQKEADLILSKHTQFIRDNNNLSEEQKNQQIKHIKETDKEYIAALDHVKKVVKEVSEEQKKLGEMRITHERDLKQISIDIERDKIANLKALGAISESEALKREQGLEKTIYQTKRDALTQEAELNKTKEKEHLKTIQAIEKLDAEYNRRKLQTDNKIALEQRKNWKALADGIKSSFGGAIKGMITGATTFQQAMQQMSKQVLGLVMEMGIKMLQSTIKNVWASVFAHQAGEAAKTTSTEEGSLKRMAANLKDTIKQINNAAVSAAAGAYNAMVGIPYVGPVLGAIAAGVTYTAVLAFGAMASAAGGYEIPSGVNPVTQLHQDEMVLPADLSSGLKNIIRSGQTGDGMGGSNGTHVHMHVNTLDAKGVKSFMKANKAAVASAAVAHIRNMGSLTPARGTR